VRRRQRNDAVAIKKATDINSRGPGTWCDNQMSYCDSAVAATANTPSKGRTEAQMETSERGENAQTRLATPVLMFTTAR
jgi:hypothetical protein